MSTRKRTRQSLANDHDEDELSPSKDTSAKDVLGTVKKRKLNTYDSSETQTPKDKNIFTKLSSLFGFSSGKEKENVRAAELDELSGGMDLDKNEEDIWEVPDDDDLPVSRRTSGRGKAKIRAEHPSTNKGDIWEVEVSDPVGDSDVPSWSKAKRTPKITPKAITNLKNSRNDRDLTPKRSAGRPKREVEVELESEATPQGSRGRPRKGAEVNPDVTPKRSGGRPRKDVETEAETTQKVATGPKRKSDILKKAKAEERKAIRQRMSAQEEGEQSDTEDAPARRRSGRPGKLSIEDTNNDDEETRQEPRGRGRPRKDIDDINGSIKGIPKGILTPSKNRGIRPRKSVLFETTDEMDLGFTDIPEITSKELPKQRGRKRKEDAVEVELGVEEPESIETADPISKVDQGLSEGDGDSDDSDDATCAICGGLESEEPNEILFCDECDNGFHQLCYGVPHVPEGDWLCKDCRPDVDDLLDVEMTGNVSLVESPNDVPDIPGFENHLRNMQRILLDKLTGQRRINLTGHEEAMQKVHQVVEQTVLAGEGNSMLVIGSRGCGKTNLVESVISDLAAEHRENFHVVRLNGFVHTDDKLALKEIWRQLGREMEVEDDLTVKSNYADTLASLLALLSHPSEISDDETGQTAKSVVFVLDEFDLFTTHPRQTLLYNLFDIAQARKAPIVVLGLTTRVDVVEALEKRVKSRFSHRYVHLSLPRSIPAYWEICKAGLTADLEEFDLATSETSSDGLDEFMTYWQSMIDDLYSKDAFKHHLQSHFYRTKSVSGFFTSCILPIANISLKNLPLTSRSFTSNTMSLAAPDSKLHILQGLSDLELALLIAAARLDIILDTDTCNFAMAYDEYSSLTSRHKIQTSSTGMAALGASAKVWGRDVALGAWERLAGYELLVPAAIGGGAARDSGAGGRMWKVDVGLEEITGSVDGLSGVMAKWCREI